MGWNVLLEYVAVSNAGYGRHSESEASRRFSSQDLILEKGLRGVVGEVGVSVE